MRTHRHYERQIDKLLAIIDKQNDRLMHLAGRTWQPSPADAETLERDRQRILDEDRFVMSPSDDFTQDF